VTKLSLCKKFFATLGKAYMLASISFLAFQLPDALAQSLEEAAKQEGMLTLYFGMPIPNIRTIADAFMKKYPYIRVDYVRAGGPNLLQKILAEKAGGKPNADVIQMVVGLIGAYKEEGILAKYVSPESKFYPEDFKDPEGFWTGLYSTYKLFIYNTKLVPSKEVPKTFADLLNPRWKKEIGIGRNEFEWYIGMLDFLGEEKGKQFMKRLGDQDVVVTSGLTLTSQLMAAGEFRLSLSSQEAALELLKAGAPVGWIPSLTPTIDVPRCIGLAAGAPHPNAAKLMVDFLLSKVGQTILNTIGRTSIRPDVKRDPALETLNLKLYPFRPKSSKQMERLVKEYRSILLKE
jgi:ABC-type Fe3+ transport system substrate-binding protein